MSSDFSEALARLKELVDSPGAAAWLEGARAEKTADGRGVLRVRGEFPKQILENRYAAQVRAAFGGRVDIVSIRSATRMPRTEARIRPQLYGRKGEYAVRIVRAFIEGGPLAKPLVVVHGPPRSGKSALVAWAGKLGARDVFHLDLERVRSGRSRQLVPRKPLVIADGVERLGTSIASQRTFIRILDTLRDRGDRALVTVEGHPREVVGLHSALVNRLEGGMLVALEKPGTASLRIQLRDQARRMGRILPREWEEELIRLPHAEAVAALETRLQGGVEPRSDRDTLERMKDVAARLLDIDRGGLDGSCRKRVAVEGRRVVMVAARRCGIEEAEVAAAFGFSNPRPVRDALRILRHAEARDPRLASILAEVGRVRRGV